MLEVITANYVHQGGEWQVSVIGDGQTLTATGADIVATRDEADQLVQKIASGKPNPPVVHLLDGDGVDFTLAYLTARHGLDQPAPVAIPAPAAPVQNAS